MCPPEWNAFLASKLTIRSRHVGLDLMQQQSLALGKGRIDVTNHYRREYYWTKNINLAVCNCTVKQYIVCRHIS